MKKTKQLTTLFLAFLATGILSVSVTAEDNSENENEGDENQIQDMTSLPAGVQSFIKALPKGAEDIEVEAENEDGVKVYELEYEFEDKEYTFELTGNGDVIEIERSIVASQLPKAVTDALVKEFGTGEILEAQAIEVHFYEIEVKSNGKVKEVKILANGQFYSDEEGEHMDHDDDDNDHYEKGEHREGHDDDDDEHEDND